MREKRNDLRPVIITRGTEEKGYFHGFFQYSDGEYSEALAIIETEDGALLEIPTNRFKFDDVEADE
ncbi:hypothetical protein SAMN05192534_12310 [Alteribacillus persepolensis]|uniref:YolD-like protein n=1 Tax=Alteribacillus persepolensis TaxID=568899 RepID=A0A1G8I653_9BACI|nr:hypothetical protein [Alteribacillus persepolensis]SDI14436.1 hypothetical protein SAMN05192534_12310 [Alteribacillus persepolensis]